MIAGRKMKNEFMARAMSCIDDALIDEANVSYVRRAKVLTPKTMNMITKFGSIAACAILVLGMIFIGRMAGNDVLLYGESVSDSPRTITEYMPRAVTHLVDPSLITEVSLPLELEFKKETTITLADGVMSVIDKDGNTIYIGNSYIAKGEVSICVQLPQNATEGVIMTNRGYDIVLSKEEASGVWLVNIEK
jgi:hypothetical protein